ncbi:MAG: hypothetical protein HUJ76_01920 [Parasporobacterium sp.]|nr:hypothetical protein [Parasporobacterium sp.]
MKNRITDIYMNRPPAVRYALRFVLALIAVMIIRANLGFNDILSNMVFVVIFSAACMFLPPRVMLPAVAAYAVVQIFSLSAGLGVITAVLFAVMYLVYFRFNSNLGYLMILIPLLCMIRLPMLLPVVLAISAPAGSAGCIIMGLVSYYYLHYLHINAAVFQGIADTGEITKMSMALTGLFTNKELLITLICSLIVFFAAYYIKKIPVNSSNHIAVASGSGLYLVLIIICNLMFGAMTYSKLWWLIAGCVITYIIGLFISGIVLPLDYTRTEFLEFEDEEYKYFVRAVPKAQVARESVKIKRIYSRKKQDNGKDKEETL